MYRRVAYRCYRCPIQSGADCAPSVMQQSIDYFEQLLPGCARAMITRSILRRFDIPRTDISLGVTETPFDNRVCARVCECRYIEK